MVPDPDEPKWDYRLAVSSDFVRRTDVVSDQRGELYKAPGLEFGTSFGGYNGRPSPCQAARCRQWTEMIGGRPASITRDAWVRADGRPHTLNVYIPVIQRHQSVTLSFAIIAGCDTEAACERALVVARTTRIFRRPVP